MRLPPLFSKFERDHNFWRHWMNHKAPFLENTVFIYHKIISVSYKLVASNLPSFLFSRSGLSFSNFEWSWFRIFGVNLQVKIYWNEGYINNFTNPWVIHLLFNHYRIEIQIEILCTSNFAFLFQTKLNFRLVNYLWQTSQNSPLTAQPFLF